jgi:hypothetical protein
MTTSVQLETKMSGRESQGACRQDEVIGGKPPVIKSLSLTNCLINLTDSVDVSICSLRDYRPPYFK